MNEQRISLRAARVNANMTQEQAAKELKVAKKTIQNWERGASFPNIIQARAIQNLFHYPVTHILFGQDKAESDASSPDSGQE